MIIFNDTKVFSTFEPLSRPDNLRCLEAECVGFVLSSIDLAYALRPPQLGFACRRGERPFGPSRIRPCGLTAALHPGPRFARLASTSLPGRSAGLRSGLFCGAKRSRRFIRLPRPVRPFACSGRANLPSKHTHMRVLSQSFGFLGIPEYVSIVSELVKGG